MKAPLVLVLAAAPLALSACADWQSSPSSGSSAGSGTMPSRQSAAVDTQTYINQASAADIFEIESSKLALQKSSDPAVQALARQMIEDHTRSSAKLESAAGSLGLKSQVKAVGGVAAQNLMQMRNLSGREFDQMYLTKQAEAHEQAYNIHSGYAAHGETPQLRSLASETAALIQQHRSHVSQASAQAR